MGGNRRQAALLFGLLWGCASPVRSTLRASRAPSVQSAPEVLVPSAPALDETVSASDASEVYDDLELPPPPGDALYESVITAENPPPPLPRGTTVLTIGDSMAQALGVSLGRRLKQRGLRHFMAAKAGTRLTDFAGPAMAVWQDLAFHDPDLVIISLGGNEVTLSDPKLRVWAIEKLLAHVGDRPCVWVATPLWPGLAHTGILQVIREHAGKCRYVDTNALIPHMERTSDGIHPTWPERENWAELMVRWLLHNRIAHEATSWTLREPAQAPPAGSEAWLELR